MAALDSRSASTRFKTTVPPPETSSLRQYAGRVGCSYTKAQQDAQAGTLPVPVIKIGRTYRIPTRAIDRLLGINDERPDSA